MPGRTLTIGAITTKKPLRDDNILRLSDGRQLGYAEYGDHDGEPVVLVHGNPGSRLFWGSVLGSPFLPGLRIIAPDRPGYGLSDFHAADTVTAWPNEVEELADSLGIERFTMAGVSAGGPYALACAWKIPHRLKSVGIVSSVGPIDKPGATAGMNSNRLLFLLAPRWPWLIRLQMDLIGFGAVSNPEPLLWHIQSRLPAVDRAVLARPEIRENLIRGWAEAYRQGGQASAYDCAVPGRWPIPLDEIKMECGVMVMDIAQAESLLLPPPTEYVIAGKAYGAETFVQVIRERGAVPVIPPRSNRKMPREYDAHLYKERHLEAIQ